MVSKDLLYIHLDMKGDDLKISSIARIFIFSASKMKICFDVNFSGRGMSYSTFAPYARELYLLIKNNVVVAENAQQSLSLLKRLYSSLSFKLTSKFYQLNDFMSFYNISSQQNDLNSIKITQKYSLCTDKTVSFLCKIFSQIDLSSLDLFEKLPNKINRVPSHLKKDVDKLPNTPGIYIFYGEGNVPIYIGKSIKIKDRVLSHFSARHQHPKELKIFKQTKTISFQNTNGEFGALLLESQLIKQYRPIYNRRLRRTANIYSICESKNKKGYSTLSIEKIQLGEKNFDDSNCFGFYRGIHQAKLHIENMVKEHSLCGILSGIESGNGPCFLYQLSKCKGACLHKESSHDYNKRLIQALYSVNRLNWPYETAIAIEERGKLSSIKWHVFDKWCYLGSAKTLRSAKERRFITKGIINDIDSSKYLSNYMKKNKDKVVVIS